MEAQTAQQPETGTRLSLGTDPLEGQAILELEVAAPE